MKHISFISILCLSIILSACSSRQGLNVQNQNLNTEMENWKTVLKEKVPLYGAQNEAYKMS